MQLDITNLPGLEAITVKVRFPALVPLVFQMTLKWGYCTGCTALDGASSAPVMRHNRA